MLLQTSDGKEEDEAVLALMLLQGSDGKDKKASDSLEIDVGPIANVIINRRMTAASSVLPLTTVLRSRARPRRLWWSHCRLKVAQPRPHVSRPCQSLLTLTWAGGAYEKAAAETAWQEGQAACGWSCCSVGEEKGRPCKWGGWLQGKEAASGRSSDGGAGPGNSI
jgi:hypothetical protein